MASIPKFPAGTTTVTSSTTTRTTTTTIHRTTPHFDLGPIRTLGGILKLVELLLDILTLICAAAGPFASWSAVGWTEFVSITAFIVTLVMLILYLFHVVDITPNIPWLLLEIVYCGIWVVFYMIAAGLMSSISAKYYDSQAYGAAAFFGFLAMVVYGIDCIMKFIGWRRGQLPETSPPIATATTASPY